MYNIIKEPWDTPQRATPKSCYPCKKNAEKISKNHNKYQKTTEQIQSTHSKTNSKK